MCTVSWAWSGATGAEYSSYELGFNRDERLTRGQELAPRQFDLKGTQVLAPTDGDHGGTWLALNEHGLTTCLLNGYAVSRGPERASYTSRGLLVRELSDSPSSAHLMQRLQTADLQLYPPFVLLAISPGAPAAVARWDGLELTLEQDVDDQRPLASSGHDQQTAQRWRSARYAELLAVTSGDHGRLLERFLCDHAQGASAFTACMHRPDAATRSQCRVRVDAKRVELVHVPGPPCRIAPSPAMTLARRMSTAPA